MAVETRDRGDSCRLLVGDPRHAARPVTRLLFDEPRRPGAAGVRRHPSALQDAVEVEHDLLRADVDLRRLHSW